MIAILLIDSLLIQYSLLKGSKEDQEALARAGDLLNKLEELKVSIADKKK